MNPILETVQSQHVAGMELFGYQERILDALRDAFREGHRAVCLVAPTGAGKTEMAIELLGAVANKGNRGAMVLDRIVLCEQTSNRLDKYGIDHGVMQAGHWRFRADRPIQVCSAQTLEKRGSLPGMRLLIVDECHQTRRQIAEFIKQNRHSVLVVGLTATPFTKGLGKIYSKAVSAVSTRELVDVGRLAPLRVYIAKEVDMTGAKKVAGEWSSNEAEARSMVITGDVVSEWVKKTNEVFGGPRKTVVFASGVKHAADLAQQFGEAGYNFVSLSYKDDDEFKADAIREFAKPDTSIHGLIATDILTKGFDVPDVMVGISARPFSKSLASHVQQMGRVMRSNPGKEFGLWLCMARGSRVLTNKGLVPIEKVSLSHKIWDGTNFVQHGGAVCNGIQKVITYQGLTATPGHLVHTAQGWRTFGYCASEQIAITQTGFGESAIRIGEDHFARRAMAWLEESPVHSCGVRVREVWASCRHFIEQLGRRAHEGLQSLQPACASLPDVALCASAGHAGAVPQPQGRELSALWSAGRGVSLRGGQGRDALDHGEHWYTGEPGGYAVGSTGSVWALRTGQSSLALGAAQPTEQAWQSVRRSHAQVQAGASRSSVLGQHAQEAVLVGDDRDGNHRALQSSLCETEREVWDILDAGPRNRFTCEGLLVHNCHSGNYLRFREDWEDIYENGINEIDDGREKPKKEKTDKEKESAKCPCCSRLWPARSDSCPSCGFVRAKRSDVVTVPGELDELMPTKGPGLKASKQEWYSQLLTIARGRGYSDGWVSHKYREKFGVWPKGLSSESIPVSLEVQRWVQSRQIAWAKSSRRAA